MKLASLREYAEIYYTPEPKITPVLERAEVLETKFAISHPAVERFMREVIDALVKIGV